MNPKIYQNALDSQNAVNLVALVNSLARDLDDVRKEPGACTETIYKHPVVRLYLEQLCFLAGLGTPNDVNNRYSDAYGLCLRNATANTEEEPAEDCVWDTSKPAEYYCLTHRNLMVRNARPIYCVEHPKHPQYAERQKMLTGA